MKNARHDNEMTFFEHLGELRSRVIRATIALAAAFFAAWIFHVEIFEFLARPVMKGLAPHGISTLAALQVTEGVAVYLKASLVAAVVLASPVVIWQLWAFVGPALHRHERRLVGPTSLLIAAFFGLGVFFSYAVFVPLVVDFLAGFTAESGNMTLTPTVQNAFGMAMSFMLMFGLVFELPLVMMFLGLLNIVTPRTFLKYSRHFIVIAFIVGAILTPPEPVSQTLMSIPLCLLYMLGILLAWAGRRLGGDASGGQRRAAAAIVLAVGLFAAGIAGAAWLWNRPAAEPQIPVAFNACFVMAVPGESSTGRIVRAHAGLQDVAGPVTVSVDPGGTHFIPQQRLEKAADGAKSDEVLSWPGPPSFVSVLTNGNRGKLSAVMSAESARAMTGWPTDEPVTVTVEESPVGTASVTLAGKAARMPDSRLETGTFVSRFVAENLDDAFEKPYAGMKSVVVTVSVPKAARFLSQLTAEAERWCR